MSGMKNIFIFPGQGAQAVGMGEGFMDLPWAAAMWGEAAEVLGYDLRRIVMEGPEDELRRTEITQPAVYMTEIIIREGLLEKGVEPAVSAGHSLGEYAAVVAAGAIDWQQGLELVKYRAEIFEKTSKAHPGTMFAVIGLEEDKLNEIAGAAGGVMEIVNYNSPGQLVISVSEDIRDTAGDLIKNAGAKMVVPLKVSGGFHSSLMDNAVAPMKERLDAVDFRDPDIDFYSNYSGEKVSSGEKIKEDLAAQVNSPVLWTDIINRISSGLPEGRFIEAGPGRVLQGLVKRISRRSEITGAASPEDIDKIVSGGDE